MSTNTYWLHWQFAGDKFKLLQWQENNELAKQASRCFWPSISIEQSQGTVLLECHQTGKTIERDISNQHLPNLSLAKLDFANSHIVATPKHDALIGDYIECVYTIGE